MPGDSILVPDGSTPVLDTAPVAGCSSDITGAIHGVSIKQEDFDNAAEYEPHDQGSCDENSSMNQELLAQENIVIKQEFNTQVDFHIKQEFGKLLPLGLT